jgi:hypothetical protein
MLLTVAVDGPAAFSTHGDVVENVLDELVHQGVPLPRPLELPKGSTWILQVCSGAFAGARYIPPP